MAESPEWDLIAEQYFFDRVENLPTESIEAIANGNTTEFRNDVFNSLMEKARSHPDKNWGDLNSYSVVKNHKKMFEYVQRHAQEIIQKGLEVLFEKSEARRVSESIPTLESGRKSPTRWDESEIFLLQELSQQGYSTENIAEILGKTISSVKNKKYRT